MIVSQFNHMVPSSTLLSWMGMPGSVYYYKNRNGKRGAKPSTHTFKLDGSRVENQVVVEEIKDILSQEFCCYGYENVTQELRKQEYYINEKKVYRLMDEQNLLLGKVIRTSGKRKFVQHRKIQASYPMEYLCLDIKYIYVHADKRNYYLLTILDVFSRKTVDQIFQKSIRQLDVINAFRRIRQQYGIKGVTIRNDNGSQFIANSVKQYLRAAEANQEFTHIATPEENSYIEAFHSIVQREVVDRFEFDSFYHAKHTLAAHRSWYDNRRNHRNIGMTPLQKWEQNIHITEKKRAERTELQDINKMASELSPDINKYYTTNSLLLSNL
ncbi:transposase InsO family protein [Arcticibacter tournemirensis]|uniref:DDE-type integrase/transposase/recombinase n=1 Tax=Arcticibacter tournemirensis TaxID=699437 RepID=UPI00116B3E4D|nr:DDE-type integrase/transposase/recombinase [Arcticibacter tournemirensis]TQM51338.1 transposase InsO family protein [Arcticibacter tournemirensis]TQM51501.1 transposase InsO family protein [Arcticibacter tournemirensis]TQM51634.1 transposase InsO family protein [Arcticibacter tournemirensis]